MEENDEIKSDSSNKKAALEDLNKEELVRRCKNYLVLAQRAKIAKDDALKKEEECTAKIALLESKIALLQEDENDTKKNGLKSDVANLTTQLEIKEQEIKSLNSENTELTKKLQNFEKDFTLQKEGFVEELNEMNTALKQRGETITRLEEKLRNAEKDYKAKLERLLFDVSEREKKIEQLESDVSRLESQSEVMSTSTVSKAEEIHRMKDVEDSLEERYNKLKMLAVRMKKKIAEQSAQLLEKENQQLSSLGNDHGSNNRNVPLNLQGLQKDIDRLQDELDSRKSQLAVMKKDFENAVQELANSKQRAEEYKNEASVLKSSLANVEAAKLALEKSSQEFKTLYNDALKENEADKMMRLELSKECDRLRGEIRQLNSTIEDLNRSILAAKQESKKQSLLQLEITDYEKTLSELHAQLDSLHAELKEKDTLIEQSQEEKIRLREQLDLLEQQANADQRRATDSKAALEVLQSEFQACQSELQQQKIEMRELVVKVEAKGSEVDSLRLELSLANGELQKVQTGSALRLESLRKQIVSLEETLAAEVSFKESLERRFAELQAEYDGYKIRATSVLKKQKTEGHTPATSTQETVGDFNTDQVEREMLQRVVEALKGKIAEMEAQMTLSQNEISSLRAERERIAAAQVMNAQVMQERLGHIENQMETAKREHQAQITRLQSDNHLLSALNREQVEGLKLRHAQELMTLQNELDAAGLEIGKLQKLLTEHHSHRTISPIVKADPTRDSQFSNTERERVEGSEDESISPRRPDSSSGRATRKPIPLDQLLGSSLISDDTDVLSPAPEPTSLDQLKESLSVSEKRCRHMASLLAESEANEARLSQLVDALKEEIRRTERSEERQKHIENLEYLKNVILKFVTLPRGEERSRLIPVLTTLLRLSPAEVQEVNHTFGRNADGVARPMAWGGVFNYFAPNQ